MMAGATGGSMRLRAARWAVALGLAAATVQLARTGAADFLRLAPCAYLDGIEAGGQGADAALLAVAGDRLELAHRIDARNPVIEEYRAVVLVHRANLAGRDLPLRLAFLEEAASQYARTIDLRPGSPYLWAGLATVRAALVGSRAEAGAAPSALAGERNALRVALRQAFALGGYEAPVLAAIVKASPALGPRLPEDVAVVEGARRRLRAAWGMAGFAGAL